MQIFIKTMLGKTLTIECEPHSTVEQIKQLIYEKEGFPIGIQILIYNSQQLGDKQEVQHATKLYLVYRLGGGLVDPNNVH